MAHLVSIACTPADIEQRPPDRYARVAVDRALLVERMGIEGDTKGCGGRRQLNVMLAETVERLRVEGFRTTAGELGEQIVIAGLDPESLAAGVRLRVGETAVIELTYPRTPCSRFARIQGKAKESARGRIGFMARVIASGEIVVGSLVRVESRQTDPAPPGTAQS